MSKILVIEDNADILEEVMTWLELEGYEATGASNGNLGVQLAFKMQPNLILCDIMTSPKRWAPCVDGIACQQSNFVDALYFYHRQTGKE